MKRIIYIILPALFLVLGAGKDMQNINKNSNADKQKMMNDLKTGLEEVKKISTDKPNISEENYSVAKEISLGNEIVLQDGKDIKVEQKIFRLNLPKREYLLLYGPTFGQKIATTHDKNVVWKWDTLSSKYFYKISMKLDNEQNCLFITISPTQNNAQETPLTATTEAEQAAWHVTYASFNLSEDENTIFFDGKNYGMNNHEFRRPIVYME